MCSTVNLYMAIAHTPSPIQAFNTTSYQLDEGHCFVENEEIDFDHVLREKVMLPNLSRGQPTD